MHFYWRKCTATHVPVYLLLLEWNIQVDLFKVSKCNSFHTKLLQVVNNYLFDLMSSRNTDTYSNCKHYECVFVFLQLVLTREIYNNDVID